MITDAKGLADLPQPLTEAHEGVAYPLDAEPVDGEKAVWFIPRPEDGMAYTRGELARLCGIQPQTVQVWMSRGLKAPDGRMAKLESLRVPRGRITPAALCRFWGLVNGVTVRMREG